MSHRLPLLIADSSLLSQENVMQASTLQRQLQELVRLYQVSPLVSLSVLVVIFITPVISCFKGFSNYLFSLQKLSAHSHEGSSPPMVTKTISTSQPPVMGGKGLNNLCIYCQLIYKFSLEKKTITCILLCVAVPDRD